MSTNCLITKLKGSVSADLPKYDSFEYDIPANLNFTNFSAGLIKDGTIKCTGDVEVWNFEKTQKVADSETAYTLLNPSSSLMCYVKSGASGGRLIIEGKYSIVTAASAGWAYFAPHFDKHVSTFYPWFKGTDFKISELSGIEGSVADVVDSITEVTVLGFNANSKITGSIADLVVLKDQLVDLNIGNPVSITVTMAALVQLTSLTALKVFVRPSDDKEVINFVKGQIANGRTSATMTVTFERWTFNGTESTWTNKTLSWTSNGTTATVTLDGTSVTVDL